MGYSDEARQAAALARKIKSRAGQAAYDLFRKTGAVPGNLEELEPGGGRRRVAPEASTAARRAAKKPRLPKVPSPKQAELARAFPELSDPDFLKSMANRPRKPSAERLQELASAQAQHAMPNEALIKHYTDTKIFARRDISHSEVRDLRDRFYNGEAIPLWAAPVGTPVAIYRNSRADVPMIMGKIAGFSERRPPEESGQLMRVSVPYTLVQGQDGKFYEWPSLFGGPDGPHVRYSSFAAISPIERNLDYIPTIGWDVMNFYRGPDQGPSGVGEFDMERLSTNMTRAYTLAKNRASKSSSGEGT